MSASVRPAHGGEAEALAALKRATFRATFVEEGGFAIPYPPAACAAFEEASYAPAKVAAELADPAHRHWVAERDGRLVGYAHVGPCKLPHSAARPDDGELYQLYLSRDAQGSGLGARLFDASLAFLDQARPGPVWLGVWSGNLRAQAFYARRGFAHAGEYRLPFGDGWEDEEFIWRRG